MKTRLLVGVVVVIALTAPGGVKAADPARGGPDDVLLRPLDAPQVTPPKKGAEPTSPQATVTVPDSGLPVLSIRSWKQEAGHHDLAQKVLDRPSIQMALVLDKAAEPALLSPLAIDGSSALTTWKHEIEMLDQPIQGVPGQTRKSSMAFLEYGDHKLLRLRAHDNSSGKAAVYGLDETGTRLVFYVLEPWTDLRGDFRVELHDLDVANQFCQPGRVRIWLLDDEKPFWSDTIAWPGKQEAKVHVRESNAAPANPRIPPEVSGTPAARSPLDGREPVAGRPAMPTTNIAPPGNASPNVAGPTSTAPAVAQPANRLPMTSPPAWPANPAPAASSNPEPPRPQRPVDIKQMSVDELVDHIEKKWQSQMASSVRRKWQGGIFYFYKTENPPADRLNIFMNVVRDCYWSQSSGELRDAFLVLYVKLKQRHQPVGGR
jgi:hypothetical protein